MRGILLKAGRKKGIKDGIRKGTGTGAETETKTGTGRGRETEVEIEIELGKGIETRNMIATTGTVTGSGVREEKGSEIEMMMIIIGLETMRGNASLLLYCTAICYLFHFPCLFATSLSSFYSISACLNLLLAIVKLANLDYVNQ